jgi:rod shape-determining protein MreC
VAETTSWSFHRDNPMQRLLNFILQNRGFFTFLALELVCAWLIVKNNSYQGAKFFNSSNAVAASLLAVSQDVGNYLDLKTVNSELSIENARLRQLLDARANSLIKSDSTIKRQYDFVSAKVVNNSVDLFRNFITINKGEDSNIAPGMAVINSNKVVGKVKTVSANFAVVISLLNLDENVSAMISRTGNFGTIKWDGRDPKYTNLHFIPRHVSPLPGDSIVTSGLNAVFPENILVGLVSRAHLNPNGLFWDIQVELAQDFTKLQYVEVIKSLLKPEMDSIQNKTKGLVP